jgi:hypothetical protein
MGGHRPMINRDEEDGQRQIQGKVITLSAYPGFQG